MLVRVRNLIKADRKKNPTVLRGASSPKRQCKAAADLLLRRYPVMQHSSLEDSDSIEQHKKAMSEEMAKMRPRESVLLPLMKLSYQNRWDFICNEAQSVQGILEEYPALRKLMVVSCPTLLACMCLHMWLFKQLHVVNLFCIYMQ